MELDKIAPALLQAQWAIKAAKKDAQNPHLKNKYADLASVFEACKVPLNEAGIVIVQGMIVRDGRNVMVTSLVHESGQYITAEAFLPDIDQRGINAAQAMGSAISYMRRYQLSAMAGVLQEDDDGNAVSQPEKPIEPTITFDALRDKINEAKALPHLANLWTKYAPDMAKMSEQERKDLAMIKDTRKAELQDAARGEGK